MKLNMNIIDDKVRKQYKRYIFQCFLATLTILAVLFFLDILTETAIIAALGASAFIVFTMPNMYSSDPRRLLGGYLVGVGTGIIISTIAKNDLIQSFFINGTSSLIVFGAIAVGIAIFLMTITNTEHAPAAGIALGLVINTWDYRTIIFILAAILWMTIIRKILKPYMINLTSPVSKK